MLFRSSFVPIDSLQRAIESAKLSAILLAVPENDPFARVIEFHFSRVGWKVYIVNSMEDRVLDGAGVEAKFGVPPALIVDYLTLVGDSSDNIPLYDSIDPVVATRARINQIDHDTAARLLQRNFKQAGEHYQWRSDGAIRMHSPIYFTEDQVKIGRAHV